MENGKSAVKFALEGATGVMIAYERISDEPYQIEFKPKDIFSIANQEKTIPQGWISQGKNDVTEEFIRYARPLIQGELQPYFESGLPKHLPLPRERF